MPPKKSSERRPDERPLSRQPNFYPVEKDGEISVVTLFDAIYETIAGGEGKRVAPEELRELKKHLDASLELLEAISKKRSSSER